MPVTFQVAAHPANRFATTTYETTYTNDPSAVLANLKTTYTPARLVQCSVDGSKHILVRKNGFVLGALLAYNEHHNLIIRPDDVWIAILSQLNFYINAHAEELRDKFVDHQGKKELVVVTNQPFDKADFGDMAVQMTDKIDEQVKDKSLIPWLLPNFSTTTASDTVICSAITMSTLQAYFEFTMRGKCGIPQITLEGMQSDWQSILDRIDKLPEFGTEPEEWSHMLRAVLRRFVQAFNNGPECGPQADKEFWERMIDEEAASGGYYISGWLSTFCAWNKRGEFFQSRNRQGRQKARTPSWALGLSFDGVWFPRVGVPPEGYSEVDVKLQDVVRGKEYECMLLAGHIGVTLGDEGSLDTVHMAPHWFMYVKGEETKTVKRREGEHTHGQSRSSILR